MSDSISFISFMASMMQSGWPTSIWSPGLTKAAAPGAGGRGVPDARAGSPTAAPVTTELAWLAFQTGAGPAGLDDSDRAIASWHDQGDRAQEARARAIRALIELELGRGEAAAEQALGALGLAETSGSKVALAWGV